MKKNAIISVCSRQADKEEEDEPIEVVTPGSFYKENDSYCAVYEETEISGMEGTTTTLKIFENKFILLRVGTTNANMEFDVAEKSVSMYNTPYGTLELLIETKELKVDVKETGGNICVKYIISIGGQKTQTTILEVDIKTT